ncbi:Glutathione S-transferase, C-terminal-like protein [Amanita muscaria]
MVLKLIGSPFSTCGQRVAVVLREKKVPYELVPIDFAKGEHKTPAYLEKQPFGQVPYIDDDGFVLYESRAIGRYIATKYANQGTTLIPTGLKENAVFEQAASTETANFDSFATPLLRETLFKKFKGLQPDEELAKNHRTALAAKLDVYEKILSKQKYLAGDEVTLADLFHLPYGAKLFHADVGAGDLIDSRPNVKRWWNDITSRESWQAVKDGVKSTA